MIQPRYKPRTFETGVCSDAKMRLGAVGFPGIDRERGSVAVNGDRVSIAADGESGASAGDRR